MDYYPVEHDSEKLVAIDAMATAYMEKHRRLEKYAARISSPHLAQADPQDYASAESAYPEECAAVRATNHPEWYQGYHAGCASMGFLLYSMTHVEENVDADECRTSMLEGMRAELQALQEHLLRQILEHDGPDRRPYSQAQQD